MEQLGFLGLGIMGGPMTKNLLKAGFAVTAFDVDAAKLKTAVGQGATAAANPAEVARQSDIILACLPSAEIVEQSVSGKGGILEGCREGQVFVDHTTSFPASSIAVAEQLAAKGVDMLDAPVSGGNVGAEQATLSIMVGGKAAVFERCLPVLNVLGKRVVLMGEQVGAGGYAKLVNQIMVSIHLASVAEAFVFAKKAGLDLKKLVSVLEAGWANSTVLNVKAPKILANDYSPVGTCKIMQKDLSYITRAAAKMGVPVPFSEQVLDMYELLIEQGKGGVDQMALVHLLAHEAGIDMGQ
jgi:2-hydroxy-3-oxopropionate reductase